MLATNSEQRGPLLEIPLGETCMASRDYRFGHTADGTVPDALCTAVVSHSMSHVRWATMVVPSAGRKNS